MKSIRGTMIGSEERKEKPHVAMFPSAGMGHYMPFMHLARVLAIHHGFSVTFINTKGNVSHAESAHVEELASCGLDIHIVEMEVKATSVVDDGRSIDPFVSHWEAVTRSMDAFERALKSLMCCSAPICAIITDQVVTPTFQISAKLHLPNYVFFTSSAFMLAFVLYAPVLVSQGCDFSDQYAVLDIPGLPPIPASDIPPALKHKHNIFRRLFLSSGADLRKASGILINTFEDLEGDFIEGIGRIANDLPPIYTRGPIFLPSAESENTFAAAADDGEAARCVQWLDTQPAESVFYVSFGSRSAISAEQVQEMAHGLEGSGQRFLWIVSRSVVAASASQGDVSTILPPGFERRVKDRGVVVSCWLPQVRILSHPSIGGFLSHCGWNSVVESISYGIPLVVWPLHGDQMINARLLVDIAKVGVPVISKGESGIVSRDEVERAVCSMMIGEGGHALRRRAVELKDYAKRAIEQGGSSHKSFQELISVWKTHCDRI